MKWMERFTNLVAEIDDKSVHEVGARRFADDADKAERAGDRGRARDKRESARLLRWAGAQEQNR